jgi:uncharacterized OsmC-like protein
VTRSDQSHARGGSPVTTSAGDQPPARTIQARVHTVGCSGLRTVTVRGFRLSSGDGADVAGFDLGPSPEEHLLAAVGSSLAQTIAHVACAHDLSIDRIDIDLTADLIPDRQMAHIAGHIARIDAALTLTSEDEPQRFEALADDVLRSSPLAALVTAPVTLAITVEPVEPPTLIGDWQI